ncbi:MAG: hypothetical protein J7K81_04155 [Methanophagales archaeon]|nr:hypothetical protein [Methanophagales archaeon]
MKPISAMALLFVVFLGALFIYVSEDIPDFGDPYSPANRYVNLHISIDAGADGLEDSLRAGVIPEELSSRIKARGFPSPSETEYSVEEVEGGWDVLIAKEELLYPEPEKYYFLKEEEEGNKLVVYRYSIPVRWEEKCEEEIGVPNMVTAGLADYRGYDTLGETTVIFTAGIAVILLLRRRGKL